jgi:hypothetical protein
MNTAHIDTLQHANKLKAAGFNDTQAVAIIELQAEAIDTALEQARHDYRLDEISTRRDLKELETALKHDIELLRADTARLIAETKADLTRWIISAGFLQTALIVGILLKIGHLI